MSRQTHAEGYSHGQILLSSPPINRNVFFTNLLVMLETKSETRRSLIFKSIKHPILCHFDPITASGAKRISNAHHTRGNDSYLPNTAIVDGNAMLMKSVTIINIARAFLRTS